MLPGSKPDPDELTRQALAAADGDQLAAGAFVRASQTEVWRLLAHLADPQAAEDLTQETYLRAFRALPGFRGAASARTWLLSIARRVAVDHIRSARRRPRVAGGAEIRSDAPDLGSDPAGHVPLRLLLDSLDPARREAFVLTQLLGLRYAQAAEVCGLPVGTVRSRVARRERTSSRPREPKYRRRFAESPRGKQRRSRPRRTPMPVC